MKSSKTSLSLTCAPFIEYSLSPLRQSLRITLTCSASTFRVWSSFEILRVTLAKLTGFLFSVPPKITSSILPPRRVFEDCSPKTHLTASPIFDFPLPLGPTTAVKPLPNSRTVLSGKDLKP